MSKIQYRTSWSNILKFQMCQLISVYQNYSDENHEEVIYEIRRCMNNQKIATTGDGDIYIMMEIRKRYSVLTNKCSINSPKEGMSVCFTAKLTGVLGFNGKSGTYPPNWTKAMLSPNRLDIGTSMTSLYVYSDIVSSQIVGNSIVRLTGSVTVPRGSK